MKIVSVNVGAPRSDIGGYGRPTGHDKRPVDEITVSDPGPRDPAAPTASGVAGDFVGDRVNHGGSDKAVYAVGEEALAYWSARLGRALPPGWMGENLTTCGINLHEVVVGETWRVGGALLQVSVPRIPCRTFQTVAGRPGWIKEFTAAGGAGTYLRVVSPGTIRAGDAVEIVERPGHGVSIRDFFWARTLRPQLAEHVLTARAFLPVDALRKLEARTTTLLG